MITSNESTGISGAQAGDDFDGLLQERRNSSASAMELRLSCINPSISSLVLVIELGHVLWDVITDALPLS